jgi:dinuclear metal center YbgI/SA1388 family protein
MMDRDALHRELNDLLQAQQFKDYAPNGLQVEGIRQIQKIVTGVTASLALIEAAVAAKADTILVHHGLFWRGQDGRVTGWMRQRLALLLHHNINLYAYHLPLDAHATLGNNVQLGHLLGLEVQARFGEQQLACWGEPRNGLTFANDQALADHVQHALGRPVTLVAPPPTSPTSPAHPIRRIGWCTGGAQSYFEAAIAAGVDAFITGEISEPQAHYARECGVAYLACGHHATERYGVRALGQHVAKEWGLVHEFVDIDNPA